MTSQISFIGRYINIINDKMTTMPDKAKGVHIGASYGQTSRAWTALLSSKKFWNVAFVWLSADFVGAT